MSDETNSNVIIPKVGFVGLGAMGKGMAKCLAMHLNSQEQPLSVFNRDHTKLEAFTSDPALLRLQVKADLADMALTCNVIFTMLSHDAAVRQVMGQIIAAQESASRTNPAALETLQPARVLVDCSTVSPETTKMMSAAAEAVGALYVACPVLGRPDAAAAANLLIFCSGPDEAKKLVMPYLSAMGRKVLDLGREAHKAHMMKLLANFHLVSLIELLSEGMTLAEKNGIERDKYVAFINEILPVPIVSGYCSRIAANAFDAGLGFTVTLGLKDVNLMRKLAEDSEMPLPLADVAFNHLLAAKAAGLADKDWAALAVAGSLPPQYHLVQLHLVANITIAISPLKTAPV
ncbi:hypothetical protein VOLCADRAFT_107841 [Volvox carteri f. nagariensis]|uniref:6-phosphogluconate dehydrogenase NADP-binding domain-containing protein n=1 Tax=Volvox carteri f. nagariensis TaxID=3068 RepID=D8UGS7_VOLCA|nr:uncharacterized protein VOLCADRAFT_107841 [Volvox carteri f. nagariensis]EFJ41104.1 hypothetical protein VOLCADRAFT_107841 [Volvox carteri f. nagariensis]|eukprot:XP_002957867.1 hypothetical protein VOLCADRAFT_107841 [Volvox carteri f. nagariensis]